MAAHARSRAWSLLMCEGGSGAARAAVGPRLRPDATVADDGVRVSGAVQGVMNNRPEPRRLAALLEASSGPSPLLDAQLLHWAGIKAHGVPTASLEAAGAFVQDVARGATWTLLGGAGECTATITALGGTPCCHGASGATPSLALLAALMRAV